MGPGRRYFSVLHKGFRGSDRVETTDPRGTEHKLGSVLPQRLVRTRMNICWSLVPQGFTPTPSWSGPETPYYGHSRPCSTLLCAEVFVERLYSLLYIPASPMSYKRCRNRNQGPLSPYLGATAAPSLITRTARTGDC